MSTTTMDDVARIAGVSRKTVSRVVNGFENVSSGTRAQVMRVIEELGYTPHSMARTLATGRSRCVGVVVGHGADVAFSNPHLGRVLDGIGQTLAARGYEAILLTRDVPGAAERLIRNRQIDGLLFLSVPVDDPVVTSLQRDGVPIILTCQHTHGDIAFVDVNNLKGARLAVDHLLSLGHTSVGLIDGPYTHASSRDRLTGYRTALEAADLAFDPRLAMEGDFSEESGYRKALALLEARTDLTAMFAASDMMAIGALRAVQEAGLRVPDDVSVVGFDGISLTRYLTPPLTTVRQAAVEKGKLAAEMLVQRLAGERLRRHQLFLEPELLVRATTSVCRERWSDARSPPDTGAAEGR